MYAVGGPLSPKLRAREEPVPHVLLEYLNEGLVDRGEVTGMGTLGQMRKICRQAGWEVPENMSLSS